MTLVTLSSKNQITMPVWFLREFNIRNGDKLLMGKVGDKIYLDPIKGSITDELAGSLEKFIPKNKKGVSVDEAIRLGKLAKARKIAGQ